MRNLIRKILKEARVPKKEKVELYKDDNVVVVVPLTHKALQKYASFCQWCINSDVGEWEDYHKGKHAVIIQRNPKKPKIGITGNPVASEILIMSRWDDGGYLFEDVCGILGYEFNGEVELTKYYVNITNDINNFATNIVYYSPENGIYDMEDNFLWNFNFEISDIPNMTPEIIRIIDNYLSRNEGVLLNTPDSNNLKESEEESENYDWIDPSYLADTDKNLMDFLIQEYRVWELPSTHQVFPNEKYIVVDDKPRFIKDHKKYLVNKIYLEVSEDFENLHESVIRRTIRKFLNDILGS